MHAGIAVLLLLYLLVRLLISVFGARDRDYLERTRRRFKKPDWFFAIVLAISGLYPLISIGQFELYHLIKLIILILFIWLSRYATKVNFAGSTFLVVALIILAGISSFTDSPTFPKKAGTFQKSHPEIASLSNSEKGPFIFNTLCAQCHGNDGKLGRFGAADLSISKLTIDKKIETISKGSPLTVMRSFSKELSTEEIELVAGYIETLKD